ncbi:site-specific DNA-methyltransferase [Herpetosiphon giganteus]|uniref:site-specific DNA-methyltransferase n=1 Tax=Herpetosiphon giganteus TaxID=2029754 RepID=UPI00195CA16F|nr:site-specific DNA-methyltransferase [Herpetosiphon giganteus]MBM7845435.1 adenine-specific DNA-methyltransferase [Herpetosiphon giganteus]
MPPQKPAKKVETLTHHEARRSNIPSAEHESVMDDSQKQPVPVSYDRRNRDLDPQLMWRGKDEQDWSDLVVPAPPLYIQEKLHPKVLIDDLRRQSRQRNDETDIQMNLFADFNGLPSAEAATEFYQHEANWTNRMILGDSLQVMASLGEREGLRGKVQCIYFDPPYGIKFNSNFQWSTTSRDVKDGNRDHITREPEQVKAFRDTWRDGIHSYLTYLRDRLTVARDLLTESGSIFVQIGDENVHRVRALMDEVFGDENFCRQIQVAKTSGMGATLLPVTSDYIIWYAKNKQSVKYRQIFLEKNENDAQYTLFKNDTYGRLYRSSDLTGQNNNVKSCIYTYKFGETIANLPKGRQWKTTLQGMIRLERGDRIIASSKSIYYKRFLEDWSVKNLTDRWDDTASGGFTEEKIYVVQTNIKVVQRCILMATDPGDLVLDPTCGSGTTAYVAEQWGRRWITIDTSRVALALARARIMGARYPYYLLADSAAGQRKEAELQGKIPNSSPSYNNLRHGFVYERVPHITLKSIANNAEIDTIWDEYQTVLEPLRGQLNAQLGQTWQEWEIPREAGANWSRKAVELHSAWWQARIERQRKIDASIAAKADQELLYDKPYEEKNTVRVAGPFTVESLSPHRVLVVDEHDQLKPLGRFVGEQQASYGDPDSFVKAMLDNLRTAGVQQAHKAGRISFNSLVAWPGKYICAEATYLESDSNIQRRAGIFIGPEFGTVPRGDLVLAAREAGDAGFDVLIACAFNYDAHASEFEKLGRIPILKARMNADLHMADTLKNTGAGNLFVIFGEPDITIKPAEGQQIQVQIHGVDIFHPQSGAVVSGGPEHIACWFIDSDYNGESFFVRHAYFLGANDPYKALKTSLKAEIDETAWESLNSDHSRPFAKPSTGRIAVKVINHLGDEVMKVFSI